MSNENLSDRRSFLGTDETEYFIGTPSADAIRKADWQYSKTYTNCLVEGITTSAEMLDILKRRGVIGEAFENRVEELTTILNEYILRLREASNNEEKAELAIQISKARDNLFQWNQRLSGPMSNTCEQMADDARLEALTSRMIEYDDGTKVWPDYDAFLSSKDQALSLKSRYEVMLFLQGYESDFLDNTPEAVAMQEVQTDIINQASVEAEKARLVDLEKDVNKPGKIETPKSTDDSSIKEGVKKAPVKKSTSTKKK